MSLGCEKIYLYSRILPYSLFVNKKLIQLLLYIIYSVNEDNSLKTEFHQSIANEVSGDWWSQKQQ